MSDGRKNARAQAKLAEYHVFGELLKRGVSPYLPMAGSASGVRVRTPAGWTIEMRIEHSTGGGGGDERRFQVTDFKPRPELFFLCIEFTGDDIDCVWTLPSTVFFVYSDPDEESGLRALDLDAKRERYFGKPFREYNSFFRNRWEPITEFDPYRRYMKPWGNPGFADGWEDFEDLMLMLETIENREPREEEMALGEPEVQAPGQYKIRYTRQAIRQLERLPPNDSKMVVDAIESLASNPRPPDALSLGDLQKSQRNN